MKRLAVFLDGTWNDPKDNTNVLRLYQSIADADANGVQQLARYDDGVGNKWFEKFRGGVFGYGISEKVRQAYGWLVANYEEGDEIWLFGFSRGAYTARSVAGIISRRGLLRQDAAMTVDELYELYRNDDVRKLAEGARRVPIHFTGVFDTVGELGVPLGPIRTKISRVGSYFHNTNPSVDYHNMYQALAIDEHRPPYAATLWTRYVPLDAAPDPLKQHQSIEQRWFAGSHTNVGGGKMGDPLTDPPLAWMQERAAAHGLAFAYTINVAPNANTARVKDSFGRFLFGLYRLARLNKRHYRRIGAGATPIKSGKATSLPINESIDSSVFERYRSDPSYRDEAENLAEWADREGVDPDTIAGTQNIGIQL